MDPFETPIEENQIAPDTPVMPRVRPEPEPARAALVTQWQSRLTEARSYWHEKAFRQMVSDMKFAAGEQWTNTPVTLADGTVLDPAEFRYVANITLRHIQSRTASIYGKNPKIVARRKTRLLNTVWDGTQRSLMMAMDSMATAVDPQAKMAAMAVIQDATASMADAQQKTQIAKTLELLFEHELDEQALPFKVQMKSTVRRGLTTGVGYVKLGYQRIMELDPAVTEQIELYSQKLATLERISADIADGETDQSEAEAEQLRLIIQDLSKGGEVITREGLLLTYPDSTSIIFDPEMKQLRGFVGASWAAEEYYLTADKIKEIYKVDLVAAASNPDLANPRVYDRTGHNSFSATDGKEVKASSYHCVWEVYNRDDGMVYVVCDGWPDFLVEPGAPDVKLERFYPWFPFVVNEVYSADHVIPPSDVKLIRDMQMELNRARQGLREHRRAARPRTYTRGGLLSATDRAKLQNGEPFEVIELNALGPNEKVTDVLQDYSGPRIDPALYDPSPAFEDYLRTLGQQEANLGGTSGATATEASIAEGSRVSSVSSVVDDLDEFLCELARAAGQVLLAECSEEHVKTVVGPGAVWPSLSGAEIAREIYLDVEAASTGRPNKAQEVQTAQAVFPLLMQIPGLDPEWLARELLRRMDDRIDITDAFASGMPSVQMLNQAKAMLGAGQGVNADPNAQGASGGQNAQNTAPPRANVAPRAPEPGIQQNVQTPVV